MQPLSWTLSSPPSDGRDRLRWLAEFLARWRRPLRESDIVSQESIHAAEHRLGFALPAALRDLHLQLGAAHDLVRGGLNRLVTLDDLAVEGSHLVIWLENQAVVRWGIPVVEIVRDDPRVDIDLGGHPDYPAGPAWVPADPTLSEMATRMLVWESTLSAPFSANGASAPEAAAWIRATMHELPFAPWKWPTLDSRMFADRDVLVSLDSDEWVWVGTMTRDALAERMERLGAKGVQWESWPE